MSSSFGPKYARPPLSTVSNGVTRSNAETPPESPERQAAVAELVSLLPLLASIDAQSEGLWTPTALRPGWRAERVEKKEKTAAPAKRWR